MTPGDRSTHRLLPLWAVSATTYEQPEFVLQALEESLGRQHSDASGNQLDSERQAVKFPADRRHRCRVRFGEREVGSGGTCPFDEQANRFKVRELLRGRLTDVGRREAQRWDAQIVLAPDSKPDSTCDENLDRGRRSQDLADGGSGVSDLF